MVTVLIILFVWAISYDALSTSFATFFEDAERNGWRGETTSPKAEMLGFLIAPAIVFFWWGPLRKETRQALIDVGFGGRMPTFQEMKAKKELEERWL